MSKVFSAAALVVALTVLLASAAFAKPTTGSAAKTKTPIAVKATGSVKASSGGALKAKANGTTLKTRATSNHPIAKAKWATNGKGKAKLAQHHRKHRRHHHKQGSNASATGTAHMSVSGKLHSSQAGSKSKNL